MVPVIGALAADGVPVSVDTYRAAVAAAALDAGATVVNDVSGGLGDPGMAAVVRAAGCPWILMHWRGHSRRMQELAHYDDVVADVRPSWPRGWTRRSRPGSTPTGSCSIPGLGFAKTAAHNWALLAQLDVLVGSGSRCWSARRASRSSGALLAGPDGTPAPGRRPGGGHDRAHRLCGRAGAWGVRVHEVPASVDAARTIAAVREAVSPMTDRIALTGLRCAATTGSSTSSAGTARTSSSTPSSSSTPRRRRRPTTWPTPSTTASWPRGWPP